MQCLCLELSHFLENFTYCYNLGSDLLQTKIILSFLTLLFLTFLVPSDAFGDWYDTSWDHRNKITVSLNAVTSSDLSDFPVLISLTDSDFTQANSDGSDFVFTSSDGTTVLDHEIEKFVSEFKSQNSFQIP